jgi:hypothetical protein
MSELRQRDNRVQENREAQETMTRIAAKLRFLDAPRAPRGGLRVQAEALGLATDTREWRRGERPPALAHQTWPQLPGSSSLLVRRRS